MGIVIQGVGAYVPERVVTNGDLARKVDTSHDWILTKTGIVERRACAEDEAPSDMAAIAATRCLERAAIDKHDVDLIVVATATPDQSQPATACVVQEKLGIASTQCPAFDVNSVCSGFVFALHVAQSMMLSDPGRYRHALVIGADAFSRILNYGDRRTCVYFGDGAGAVVLSQVPGDERIEFLLGSDGRGRHCIEVPAGGSRQPVTTEVLERQANKFFMDGPKVWDFAVKMVPEAMGNLLAAHRLRPEDVDLYVLHQSNLRMIETILSAMGVAMDRTVTTVESLGNTAGASIPLTLDKAVREKRLRKGDRVVLCGFGGGLSWGAALVRWAASGAGDLAKERP